MGKRRVTSASAEEPELAPGDGGQAGSALTLYGVELTYNIGVSTSDDPSLSRYENYDQDEIFGLSEVDTSGIKVPSITVRGAFDQTSYSGRKLFAALAKMAKTKGIKALSGTDKTKLWLNYINYYDDYYCNSSKSAGTEAVTSTAITSAAIPGTIYVRINDFTVNANATTQYAQYTLTMNETA